MVDGGRVVLVVVVLVVLVVEVVGAVVVVVPGVPVGGPRGTAMVWPRYM